MDNKKIVLKIRERFALKIQRLVGWVTFPFWGSFIIFLMRFGAKYRILHIRKIRKRYKRLVRSTKGPILVCANHLTKIDSAIINWSLVSMWTYMRSFKFFPWNIPERSNFYGNFVLRFLCYVASCIPIDRGGNRDDVKKSLDKVIYLLKKGHTVTIFPEGRRSRSGRVDSEGFSYGVGRLVKMVKDCNVVCIYMRGYNQRSYSNIPRRGERFYLDMTLIRPESAHAGLRATKDLAGQIIGQLTLMEQDFFAACGQ